MSETEIKKQPVDNRKIGVAFVCFEDSLMNGSSNLKFSTSTSNWRNVQQALGLGDYGGTFSPDLLISEIKKIRQDIEIKSSQDANLHNEMFEKHYKIKDGIIVINKLAKIAKVAKVANTRVKVITAAFVGTL
jgi:hypothetical protein